MLRKVVLFVITGTPSTLKDRKKARQIDAMNASNFRACLTIKNLNKKKPE